MKRLGHRLVFLILLLGCVLAGRAQVTINLDFEGLALFSQPAEQFAAQGIHFDTTTAGLQNGITNGDSGNWGVDGPNGPFYLGFNGPYSAAVSFDFVASDVSLKVSRTNGSDPADTFTLTAYNGALIVDTKTVNLLTINNWTTASVTAPAITKIVLTGNGLGFHPFGIDHISITPVPEPSTVALLGLGLLLLVTQHRRRA